MAPLILIAALLTHLVGGSARREGTAVQLGGSIASAFARIFRLDRADVRILLMAGIAAGFGAVFRPSCIRRRKEIGGRLLRRPKRDHPATTLD